MIKTTTESGGTELSLACAGTCANGDPCEVHWLRTYDWQAHQRVLARTCYCNDETRPAPCCLKEDALSGVYIKSTCRVALLYPDGADKDEKGGQSLTPTKPATGAFCVDDCRGEGRECRRSEPEAKGDAVKVQLLDCACVGHF